MGRYLVSLSYRFETSYGCLPGKSCIRKTAWDFEWDLRANCEIIYTYMTGMRRGELIDLTCDRVNLSDGYIDLTPEDTKTEEHRRIYFNSIPELKDVITKAMGGHRNGNNYVFTKPDGNQVPKWYIQRLFKKGCKKAGVPPYRLHDLRHTFNTNMLKAGVSQTVIMKLTGHKTNEMFLRYSHIDKEQGEAAMEKLDQFLTVED